MELYSEAGEVVRSAARMLEENEMRRETASRKAFTEAVEEILLSNRYAQVKI